MKKWRCTVCGYNHNGDAPPEKCPVCGADQSLFEEVIEEDTPETVETESASDTPTPEVEPEFSRDIALGAKPQTYLGRLYQFKIKNEIAA